MRTTTVFLCSIFLLLVVPTQATDYFGVGGSGNWTDAAHHWATSSGGSTFHTTLPTPNDDVFSEEISLQIYSLDGKVLYVQNSWIYPGSQSLTLETEGLAAGQYGLCANSTAKTIALPFVMH